MKKFNGKAIYQPKNKAAEYSKWACNFYVGCSNDCEYCYCKNGILAGTMGGDKPTLKKCFRDEQHALEVFLKEVDQNRAELQEHGLFFSFTTDPMLPETIELTIEAANFCYSNSIPVYILTKKTWWVDPITPTDWPGWNPPKDYAIIGFTLTGQDELEPNAATNTERIKAMNRLHKAGFKTFASIEPVIDLQSSYDMIIKSLSFCDLYKIGLQSGKKYDKQKLLSFISNILLMACSAYDSKVYFKDSLLKQAGINREDLPQNCVTSDFKLHKTQ